MTFKLLRSFTQWLMIVAIFSCWTGCTDFLQGKPKKQDFIEVKKENLACVKDISNKIKLLIQSGATDQEVDKTFGCIDSTLLELQTRAEGKTDKNSFTTEDVFKIFDQFLHEAQISQTATNELLKFKSGLIGGQDDQITKPEISALRDFLKIVQVEVHQLLPYAKVYGLTKGQKEFSKETIQAAFTQLSVSANKIFKSTQLTRTGYQFEEFKKMMTNLNVFQNDSNDFSGLAFDVKNLLVGGESLQSEADFQFFIAGITDMLKLYSLQNQGYASFEIKDAATMTETINYIQDWIQVLENSVQFKKSKMISQETIDPIISRLAGKNMLPVQIKAKTLVDFYKVILVRVFEAGPNADAQTFSGIRQVHFVNIKREIAIFKTYMASINSLPLPSAGEAAISTRMDLSAAQAGIKSFNFQTQKSVISTFVESEQDFILSAAEEYRVEFLTERPVIYRFNKMVIASNQEVWKQNWQDLARAAYVKFLARSLMIGWGNGSGNRLVQNAEITESGLIKWYAEFKPFCIEIKLFDPRAINSGAKSFKEANLFPYSADGNDKMSFLETTQYLNILATGGGQTFNEVKDGLAKAGCNLSERDAFDFPWNQESCVYSDLRKNYKNYFNNLSYLVSYLDRMDDQQFLSFYNSVIEVARQVPDTKGRIESADLRNMIILMHYMESIYAVFDKDRNFNVSPAEMRAGYPRFRIFAKDFAYKTAKDKIDLFNSTAVQVLGYGCYSEDDLIRESFIYLVFNGRTPGLTDLNIAPCLGARSLIDFTGEVDRKTIINTFKILKAVLGS